MKLNDSARPRTPLRPAQLRDVVVQAGADTALWRPQLRLPEGTDRWWTRLAQSAQVDVWLLSWLPGHSTELHDHGGSSAAFTVLEGMLTEVRVGRHGRITGYRRPAGSITSFGPSVIHDVTGAGDTPAVSIHAYSPPLATMTFYDVGVDGLPRRLDTVRSNEPELEPAR